jgi:hypothetical protein
MLLSIPRVTPVAGRHATNQSRNLYRLEIRNLLRWSASQVLLPDVGNAVPSQYILNCLTPWCPARLAR